VELATRRLHTSEEGWAGCSMVPYSFVKNSEEILSLISMQLRPLGT
jgi:hypothetical protein